MGVEYEDAYVKGLAYRRKARSLAQHPGAQPSPKWPAKRVGHGRDGNRFWIIEKCSVMLDATDAR
jgi:hypothetical protein